MKQKMDPLCFAELREANMKRLPLFKNAHVMVAGLLVLRLVH